MVEEERALELARTLVCLAESEGLRATALLTRMDEPLGRAVGHALEVKEAIACLRGEGPADLRAVTVALSAELLVAAGVEPDLAAAARRLEALLDSGSAVERLARLVARQGGDARVVEEPERLPTAPVARVLKAGEEGYVARVEAREVGLAAIELGGGRRRLEDAIDHSVGFEMLRRVGDAVRPGDPLVRIHAGSEEAAEGATLRLRTAIRIGPDPAPPSPLLRARVTAAGVEPI